MRASCLSTVACWQDEIGSVEIKAVIPLFFFFLNSPSVIPADPSHLARVFFPKQYMVLVWLKNDTTAVLLLQPCVFLHPVFC